MNHKKNTGAIKGMIVGVGATGRRGWLTTDRAESSYGLPVFVFADDATYEPVGPALSAPELLATCEGRPMELAYCGWAEWIGGRLVEAKSEPSNAVQAGFQFGPKTLAANLEG